MSLVDNDLSLEKLTYIEDLSVRSVNICLGADLDSLVKILEFFINNRTFSTLRNCGERSEKELINLCKKYMQGMPYKENELVSSYNEKLSTCNQLDITTLSPFQKSIVKRYFEYLHSKASARARNGLARLSSSLKSYETIEEYFFSSFKFDSIPNIGAKTVEELEMMKYEIIDFIDQLKIIPNELLERKIAELILISNIDFSPEQLKEGFDSILDINGKLRLFRIIKMLIESDKIFKRNEKIVFEYTYGELSKNDLSLEHISKILALTKERVRQIKASFEKDILSYFSFLSNFTIKDFVNYGIDSQDPCLVIDANYVSKINESESVTYNTIFIATILRSFLMNTHCQIGTIESIDKRKKSKYNNNCYLILNTYCDLFDFNAFLEDINLKLSEKITEGYALHFIGYLFQFLKDARKGKELLEEIIKICGTLLFNEFNFIPDNEGYLVFEHNSRLNIGQYCYKILKESSKQMTVEEIANVMRVKYPEVKINEFSVRSGLLSKKDLFISFGRTSTYALREWEIEKENIRGGTIRDIVYEFLLTEDSPKHISDIWKHVEVFRGSTYARSILDNIKADESTRFRFMEGSFIGLNGKTYDPALLNFKKLIGSQFTIKAFEKFNGWQIQDVVEYYTKKYNYQAVQIEYVIQNKIDEGDIKLTTDNKLKI
ncbi:MAG: hypothetical protein JWM44_4485 [Bacilli bacterium]|nr:hypothetical protein [Bacilli bacterium]